MHARVRGGVQRKRGICLSRSFYRLAKAANFAQRVGVRSSLKAHNKRDQLAWRDVGSIFSGKNIEQEIGYIEGGRAFDLFDRPRATYDPDTGLLRDPNTLAIIGYITLKSTFVGSSQIAEKLFAEPGSVRLRERRDNDPAHADAEAPAKIMRRVGLNEEYDASRIGESRSNFERFASAHPVELNHAEIFAEARDRPASQKRSGQQSKCECVLGAVGTPPLNDPSLQGDTEPFDAWLQRDTGSSNEAPPQGSTQASNEVSSQEDAESIKRDRTIKRHVPAG